MKIHILHCGYIRIPEKLLTSGGHFSTELAGAMAAPDSRRVTLPVSAYLIEHPEGLYLIDTGLSREVSPEGTYDARAAAGVMTRHLAALYKPYVPEGMTVTEQLGKLGIKPEDLKAVLITHLDADHTSGLRSLAGAARIIMPEDECYWSVRTKYRLRQPRDLWDFESKERLFYRGIPEGPVRKAVKVTDDGSLIMVNLPGHTDGHAGYIVRSGSRYAVIAGDAAYSARNWENMELPGLAAYPPVQRKTLEWIAKASADPDCAGILCSHDLLFQASDTIVI